MFLEKFQRGFIACYDGFFNHKFFRSLEWFPRIVSLVFMYIHLQVMSILWAFTLNAGISVCLAFAASFATAVNGISVYSYWSYWDEKEKLLSACCTVFVCYSAFRNFWKIGEVLALIAWESLEDFPKANKTIVRWSHHKYRNKIHFLLPIIFAPLFLVTTCVFFSSVFCNNRGDSSSYDNNYDNNYDDNNNSSCSVNNINNNPGDSSGGECNNNDNDNSNYMIESFCRDTPMKLLFYNDTVSFAMRSLVMSLLISFYSYFQILVSIFPSFKKLLYTEKCTILQRSILGWLFIIALLYTIVFNFFVFTILEFEIDNRFINYQYYQEIIRPMLRVMWYRNEKMLLALMAFIWAIFLQYLSYILSLEGIQENSSLLDYSQIKLLFSRLKATFVLGILILFIRGILLNSMGFLYAQRELTIVTIQVPLIYVLCFVTLLSATKIPSLSLFTYFIMPFAIFWTSFLSYFSYLNAPGTFFILFVQIVRKCVSHFTFDEHFAEYHFPEDLEPIPFSPKNHPYDDSSSGIDSNNNTKSIKINTNTMADKKKNLHGNLSVENLSQFDKANNSSNSTPCNTTILSPTITKEKPQRQEEKEQKGIINNKHNQDNTNKNYNDNIIDDHFDDNNTDQLDDQFDVDHEYYRPVRRFSIASSVGTSDVICTHGHENDTQNCDICSDHHHHDETYNPLSPSGYTPMSAQLYSSRTPDNYYPKTPVLNYYPKKQRDGKQNNDNHNDEIECNNINNNNSINDNDNDNNMAREHFNSIGSAVSKNSTSNNSNVTTVINNNHNNNHFSNEHQSRKSAATTTLGGNNINNKDKKVRRRGKHLDLQHFYFGFGKFFLSLLIFVALFCIGFGVLSYLQHYYNWYYEMTSFENNSDELNINHAYVSYLTLKKNPYLNVTNTSSSSEYSDNHHKHRNPPRYGICDQKFNGLSALDYALISDIAYFEPHQTEELLSLMFPNNEPQFQVKIPPTHIHKDNNNNSETLNHAYFFELYSPVYNISVISLRGTDIGRLSDFIEDIRLYVEPVAFFLLSALFPTIRIWPDSTTAIMIEWIHECLGAFGLSTQATYYNYVVDYVTEINKIKGRQVILTGHSLGGGLARIIASLTQSPSVTFSPPGYAQSYRKFHFKNNNMNNNNMMNDDDRHIQSSYVHHQSVCILPENDIVTSIDTQVGFMQVIKCKAEHQAMFNACHMLEGTICELLERCGDHRSRFIGCQFTFTFKPFLWVVTENIMKNMKRHTNLSLESIWYQITKNSKNYYIDILSVICFGILSIIAIHSTRLQKNWERRRKER